MTKYKDGAYHWREMEKNLKRFNAGLAARYNISEKVVKKFCKNPKIIVDIGCGDGYLTALFARNFKNSKVFGFDIDSLAIELANEKTKNLNLHNLRFIQDDAFDFIRNSNTFPDLILATDVIEHLDNPNDFLENCYNYLNFKGFLFISTPIRFTEFPTDKYHTHEFFYFELEKLAEKNGFQVLEHLCSHDYCLVEKYNKSKSFLRIGKIRLYKYLYNLLTLLFGVNLFEIQKCKLPTMQYLMLQKMDK